MAARSPETVILSEMRLRRGLVAVGVGLVLADGSIVSLALPQILADLHTTVVGLAAILFVYMAVLAVAALVTAQVGARRDARHLASGGFALVAVAGVVCAASRSLDVMLVGRAIGAVGGGVCAVASFALLDGGGRGARVWLLASVLGLAAGPAIGGLLTQLFEWRAIFIFQVPLGAAASLLTYTWPAISSRPPPAAPRSIQSTGRVSRLLATIALACISGALSAVLFLLVLVLIAGWSVSPIRAAIAVTALPIAAIAGACITGPAWWRAAAGCLLIGAGVLALAWIPQPNLWWTVAPQLLAGVGAGLALRALSGELLPQTTMRQAGRLLSVRHAAVALVLIALGPLISTQLNAGIRQAQLQGIALVLDAKLSPSQKLKLAPSLFGAVSAQQPLASLRTSLAAHQSEFSGADLVVYRQFGSRSQTVLLDVVKRGFRRSFLIAGLLAMLAAALLMTPAIRSSLGSGARGGSPARSLSRPRRRSLIALLTVVIVVPAGYAGCERALATTPVQIADPCSGGPLPGLGGITGLLQSGALAVLDQAACRLHTSREELVLALASPAEAKRFAAAHDGVNPHSIISPFISLFDDAR
jgi:predicted MFS family arabinose efflux permease